MYFHKLRAASYSLISKAPSTKYDNKLSKGRTGMSETSLPTDLPRVQNPCLSRGFLQLFLCPSTRRGMQTRRQAARRFRGNTVESTGSRIFFNSMRDELREVCCLPKCPFSSGHTQDFGEHHVLQLCSVPKSRHNQRLIQSLGCRVAF